MVKSRSAFAIALSLGGLWCARAKTQETRPSSGAAPRVLFLERQHSGQHFEARAGDQVEIRLGSRGGCEPLISSPSLRLEVISLSCPPTPGISTRTYIFDAASAGEAEVRIPLTDCTNSEVPEDRAFVATIRVEQTARGATTPYAFRMADQDNAVSWTGAWTIL